jgi:cobalt-zinc-cadmium resistance protein CzcA
VAVLAGKQLQGKLRDSAYAEVTGSVARPVAFSVAIIMLVYLPLLSLSGIEGKMFRPMAITMACALFGALIYSVLFFPALLALFVPPPKTHGPRWVDTLTEGYARALPWAIRKRWWLIAGASAAAAWC